MVARPTGNAVLVTGAAGFIGYHVASRLLAAGRSVIGLDNLNEYYDPALKRARLDRLRPSPGFRFVERDITGRDALDDLLSDGGAAEVVHLAAQAGVRYSLVNPAAYVDANLTGFANVLEACRRHGCRHLVYASSSSVYGANTRLPFRTDDNVDHPVSFYAATKKANEAMAHSYAHLFGLPTTGLRFFTAYGPWGRPDMAMSLFARAIRRRETLRLFEGGRLRRDYTYVEDVAEIVLRLVDKPPTGDPVWSGEAPDPAGSRAPWRIVNVGSGRAVEMSRVVAALEQAFGETAIVSSEPMQAGDLAATWADIGPMVALTGFVPATTLDDGVEAFARWYADHHP